MKIDTDKTVLLTVLMAAKIVPTVHNVFAVYGKIFVLFLR